jgi:D-alanine-D-alanine ligase-like ATP-grasp enzyme
MSKDKKKKTIAVLRGGNIDYHRSMKSGANVLLSLLKYGDEANIIDVVVDEKGNWFEKGIPSDPHKVFSQADYYVDFTNNFSADYHKLSKKLDVRHVFKNDMVQMLSRINIKRILNQIGFDSPRYVVFRDDKNLENNLKEIWSKFHTPIVIKDGSHIANQKSLLTYSFLEAYKKVKDILKNKNEAIVEEFAEGKYVSLALMPNYRGEDFYVPTPIETINAESVTRFVQGKELKDKYLIEHNHHKLAMTHIDDSLKKKLKMIAFDIHKSLSLDHHILIDLCLYPKKNKKNNFDVKVVEVHTNPHLSEGSRFNFILENSGVDIGRFVLDRIDLIKEEDLLF